ncbi:MAG: hypothetical protein FWD36_06440 [Treponema sp.]|nr:hypothetical protein [Treponema sp.]
MKLNVVLTFIVIALAGLSAFGFYIANEGDIYRILITAGSGLSLVVTLGGLLALSSPNRGSIVNVRVVSGLFFLALLIVHIVFSFTGVVFSPYIIITGALLLLYILLCYLIIRALKSA